MELKVVYNSDCLAYANKDIMLAYRNEQTPSNPFENQFVLHSVQSNSFNKYRVISSLRFLNLRYYRLANSGNRKIGFINQRTDDGGFHVSILGNEYIVGGRNGDVYQSVMRTLQIQAQQHYTQDLVPLSPTRTDWFPDTEDFESVVQYPCRRFWYEDLYSGYSFQYLDGDNIIPIDSVINLDSALSESHDSLQDGIRHIYFDGSGDRVNSVLLTNDKDNTLQFGYDIVTNRDTGVYIDIDVCDNPLYAMFGDCYSYGSSLLPTIKNHFSVKLSVNEFQEPIDFHYRVCETNNGVCVPFNLILTEDYNQAKAYLTTGILPTDAFLFPLEWDNFPKYNIVPEGDDSDDGDKPTDYDDNDRDVDPTPLNTPIVTPQNLSVNNIYWLGVGEYGQFLTWFWYDIQEFSILDPTTWDNLLDNIKGLYNDVASTILSVRFMPIDPSWVGGLSDTNESIKLGMIEDDRTHSVFNRLSQLQPRKIGKVTIPKKYNSFLDVAPYSQLMVYLPFFGYVDLDIDMFSGHELHVYAVYDILAGTISYFLYYDDTALINFYVAKISVDVPITLQTAYERDRSVKENVVNYISSSVSALSSAYFKSPIGLSMSMKDVAHHSMDSPPMLAKGFNGEQGILFEPTKCFYILREPTIPNIGNYYKKTVGYLVNRTYKLGDLDGFTICSNPRITFNGNEYIDENGNRTGKMILPLQEEIDEIYDYLEKGVII